MAEYLLVRHAEPLKGDGESYGEAGPPLSDNGLLQAQLVGKGLQERGVDLAMAEAAVSPLLRAEQTATGAGLARLVRLPLLAEINTGNPEETARLIAAQRVPALALTVADQIMGRLPKQRIWLTHGLVIMALRERLGVQVEPDRFVPKHGEIVSLEF